MFKQVTNTAFINTSNTAVLTACIYVCVILAHTYICYSIIQMLQFIACQILAHVLYTYPSVYGPVASQAQSSMVYTIHGRYNTYTHTRTHT